MVRKIHRQVITSKNLSAQINPINLELLDGFLQEKDIYCADGTISAYRSDSMIFLTWNLLHNSNKLFVDIKKLELMKFFGFGVNVLKWKSARFGRMRACVSQFSEFVETYYDINNVINNAPQPRRNSAIFIPFLYIHWTFKIE